MSEGRSNDAVLVAHTRPIAPADAADLIAVVEAEDPIAWLHKEEGLVGWGTAAQITTEGSTRFSDADKWWSETVARANIDDTVNEPGTGLVGFGSFAFAESGGTSLLTVPRVIVGRRGDLAWLTTIGTDSTPPDVELRTTTPRRPTHVSLAEGHQNDDAWRATVAEAITRINRGDLDKVVLARDLVATSPDEFDVRWPLAQLSQTYPTCWTFHIDGWFGASPEMLVRRERGLVTSRVLAGTIRRSGNDTHDLALAGKLARSSKDLEEHEYAVRSVAESLEPHCSSMNLPEAPYVLHLPNVMHLATDVAGVVHDAATVSSLQLAEALHPSAAVGGTPTDRAVALIEELEGMSRGRYAGPVGWLDATGDGEWAIALRSARVDGREVRLFAGCGIVGDSDPDAELAEAQAKFVPVRESLRSDP